MAMSMRNPVVVILGATGTGKTKLSLELARRFNGEIISADSMQVYKGLDVITNKATPAERKSVPHHLIDYLSPLIEDSTIVEFRDKAVSIIDSLLDKNKVPIIVGGTNYYIESVLWKNLIDKQDVEKAVGMNDNTLRKVPKMEGSQAVAAPDVNAETGSGHQYIETRREMTKAEREKMERLTTPELYKQLMAVDRTSALKTHPNDRRKLLRALEVYQQFGVSMSDVYRAQHEEVGQRVLSGPLRYPQACMFWLHCEKSVLNDRLDNRVDQMIEDGLLSELTDFHKSYNAERVKDGQKADYSKGIFQSIGFKEFHTYLTLNEEERQSTMGQKIFEQGKEELKKATRQYARTQTRFVRTRILKRMGPADYVLPVYGLDCTDVSRWSESVATPAVSILEAVLQGKKPDVEPINPDDHTGPKTNFVYNECTPCSKVFTIEAEYLAHMKTKRHKKVDIKYKKELAKLSKILDKRSEQLQQEHARQIDPDLETTKETKNTGEKGSLSDNPVKLSE